MLFRSDEFVFGTLKMVVTTETAYGTRSVEAEVVAEQLSKILLTTDKPLYQPGQTIHIRTLSLELPAKNPIADSDITLEITDPKGNKVYKEKGKTSGYGIFAVDFTLANLVNLGNYTISALVDGNISSEKTITVERYVLPKFGIDFKADKGFYMPGETVKGSITSNYFYGKPVSGGSVHIEVKTFDVSENTVGIIDATLTKDGKYNFEAKLPDYFTGSELDQGKATVKFEITVTDTANHEQSTVKTIKVVKSPVIATLVPAAGKMLPGITQDMYLVLTDPNGTPLAAEVTVKAGENSEKITVGESGFAEFKMVLTDTEAVKVTVKYEDKTFESDVVFTKDGNSEFVFLSTDSSIYGTGDTMTVNIFTGYDPEMPQPSMLPDRAYIDVIADGQIRLMQTVEFKEGKGSTDITLDETMHGPVEILAYYLTKEGNIIRSSKGVYVRKASSLNIEFTTDKEEYKPRETAKAQFMVKDAEGKPVVAALGVAMVDEAVFHVMDFIPGMEQTYFNIESSLMESTYAIYGTSYEEIVTPVEDEEQAEEIEKKADAFFAGNAGNLSHGVAADDYSEPENAYLSASTTAAKAKADAIFKALDNGETSDCTDSAITQEKLDEILAKPENTDPWDNIMSGTPGAASYEKAVATLISAGPDETAGTKDDITMEIKVCEASWNGMEDGTGGDPTEGDTGNSGDTGEQATVVIQITVTQEKGSRCVNGSLKRFTIILNSLLMRKVSLNLKFSWQTQLPHGELHLLQTA